MINNNPYNMPERPMQKHTRIYTDSNPNNNISHFRNESIQNIPVSVISHHNRTINNPPNLIMKRSGINAEEIPSNFRPPYFPPTRNQIKHFLHSPKNSGPVSNLNLTSLNFSNNSIKDIRESVGSLDGKQQSQQFNKQISDKIEALSMAIKNNEKRIQELQKSTNNSGILPNNSKLSEHDQFLQYQKTEVYKSFFNKYQCQWLDGIKRLKDDILNVRQQVKSCIKSNDADKLIKEKVKEIKYQSRNIQNILVNQYEQTTTQMRKQIQLIRNQLDEKIKKNHDFITTVVARIEKEVHNQINLGPQYKSTGIKCTGTAILLRFIECFKVRKNIPSQSSFKLGEIKITISDNTYYIDNQGYLLDKDQFYLVDNRGVQVRLEERHVKLLREQNVLL